MNINSSNGTIRGVDIDHEFATKLKAIGGDFKTGAKRNFTPYHQLKAFINFQNGVLFNQSLSVDLEHFHLKGDGKVNMINRQIKYNLSVKPLQSDGHKDRSWHNRFIGVLYSTQNHWNR